MLCFLLTEKKLNNTVEIAITGIYTHHETIRNVHMYKHIQNQNEIKNCEDFLVHCHIIEHLKSINKHQVY